MSIRCFVLLFQAVRYPKSLQRFFARRMLADALFKMFSYDIPLLKFFFALRRSADFPPLFRSHRSTESSVQGVCWAGLEKLGSHVQDGVAICFLVFFVKGWLDPIWMVHDEAAMLARDCTPLPLTCPKEKPYPAPVSTVPISWLA